MKMTYSVLVSNDFISSFKRLMDLTDLSAKEKFALVKMRKSFYDVIMDLRESLKGKSGKEAEELLQTEHDFEHGMITLTESQIAQLSANDLFNLQPIIKED